VRSLEAVLEAELAELDAIGRRRACPEVSGLSRTGVVVSGEPRLSFCSNDYLGLAEHPALATAAAAAAARDGFGASASRLVSGDLPAHRQLEEALALEVDAILLDNMDLATLREAVAMVRRSPGRVVLEASGGITPRTAPDIAATGVDLLSVGWITHSAPALDVALDVAP